MEGGSECQQGGVKQSGQEPLASKEWTLLVVIGKA